MYSQKRDNVFWHTAKVLTLIVCVPLLAMYFLMGFFSQLWSDLYAFTKGFFTAYRCSQHSQRDSRWERSETGRRHITTFRKEGGD